MANEHVNKVILGTETLLDLTDDTAEASDVVEGKTFHLKSGARATGTAKYAGSEEAGGSAIKTAGIPYGECDSTSTATAFTATVDGITSLYDGVCVMLKNGVVTSAANFTININNLGAKPCYNNMATGNPITPTDPTRDTTIFNINYTMLLIYSEDIVSGGGWICYRGYDANTNTIGYQLRTNSSNMVAADTGYRYRIWLTSADGSKWVPINTSTSTNATTARTLNTRPIDPFGEIVYRPANGTCTAGTGLGATGIWQQYTLTIGYSYVITLTFPAPVYLRCTPQSDGSAVMNDIVQALPSSNDGKIYIFLGVAYSATAMELHSEHPVYWHDGTGIRLWTGATTGGGSTYTLSGAVSTSSGVSLYTAYDYTSTLTPSEGTATTSTLTLEGSSGIELSRSGDKITINGKSSSASSGGTAVSAVTTGEKYTWNNKQDALVSGTNIKTINNESILGSGNLEIGGGVEITVTSVAIAVADWSNNTCTKNVTGITASNSVIVTYAPESKDVYTTANVYCSGQGAGTLTFSCDTVPTDAVTANVMIVDGAVAVLINVTGTIDGNYSRFTFPTDFVPTIGQTYNAHFECSDTSIGYQGDVTLTAVRHGNNPTLTPTPTNVEEEWYVQFLTSGGATTGYFYSSWLLGGETVSLTVYG